MIFRVECRKDGSIASCVEVESQHSAGGLIFYIEAENKTDALSKAKKRWIQLCALRKGLIENRKKNKLCFDCSVPSDTHRCARCMRKKKDQQNKRRAIYKSGDRAALAEHNRQVAEARRVRMLEIGKRGTTKRVRAADMLWDSPNFTAHKDHMSALRHVLRAYDRDPGHFREWLLRVMGKRNESSSQAAE